MNGNEGTIVKTLQDLVHWIATGPGALGIIGWFVAWGLEDLAFWKALKPKIKSASVLLMSVILGCAAVFLGQHPAWMEAIAPYSTVIIGITSMWLATQVFHRFDPKAAAKNKG